MLTERVHGELKRQKKSILDEETTEEGQDRTTVSEML